MFREYRIRKLKQQLANAQAKKDAMDNLFAKTTSIDGYSMEVLFETSGLIGEIREKLRQLEKPSKSQDSEG